MRWFVGALAASLLGLGLAENEPGLLHRATERPTAGPGLFSMTAYDRESKLLTIEFQKGYAYHYLGVPQEVYAKFLRSENPGRYYNDFIRRRYEMVRAPDRCLTRAVAGPHGR